MKPKQPAIAYSYKDAPTIARFSDDYGRFIRGLRGPFGSGKSAGCVIELVKMGSAQTPQHDGKRRARIAVIRNTYRQLKDTTVKTFLQWLPNGVFGTWKESDFTYIVDKLDPKMEIEVLFRALDRPDQVSNLLSLELTAAWVNEAREVPWAIIEALIGRVGRYPSVAQGGCVNPCIIMDTNSPPDDHWWYELFEEKRPDDVAQFVQPGGLDPDAENKPNLPARYYERMIETLDEETARVYVHNQYGWVRDGKPVYPEYNDTSHCIELEPNEKSIVYRGWDFGLTPACVFAQQLPDGRFLVFDELTADSIGIDNFSTAVLEHCAQRYPWFHSDRLVDIGDPAGNSRGAMAKENETCFSILRGKQIHVIDGEQGLTIRLESVKHTLGKLIAGKPRFILHPRCKQLRRGFMGRYQYRRMQISGTDTRYQDAPDKNVYSHPHDALQYICARLFGQAVKNRETDRRKPINYGRLAIV